jgi:chromosome segregation ATPase
MQFVLITHKHGLFLQSQSLVGLCRPEADPFTKAYSLKLQPNEDAPID